MYEELVNSLRYCATHSCMGEAPTLTGCTAIYDDAPKDCDSCNAVLQWQAADAIEELQGRAKVLEKVADKWCDAVPKWIPVTERLPETDGLYLVSVKNDHKRRYSKTAWYEKQSWFARQDVTHWMPLPEPPKEGE